MGCGSDEEDEGKPIPRAAATELSQRLDEVQRRFNAATEEGKVGACRDIEDDSYPAIDRMVADLPDDVDRDVREALEASLGRLRELTQDGCSEAEEAAPEPETTPEPVAPEPPPVTQEAPPPRTETEEEPEQTTPEAPEDDAEPNGDGRGPGGTGPPGQGGGGTPAPGNG
jgi:hypothetical protein